MTILLHFNEPAGVQPSDAHGNLDDLGQTAGIVEPLPVILWAGSGRSFVRASSHALVAGDLPDGNTLLNRDVTVQALLSLTLTSASGPHTLIARGLNHLSSSEYYAFGIEFEEQAGFPGYVEARWFWQNSAGTIKTAGAGVFRHPGDGVEFLFTATRRWESTTTVVVRYYVNDEMIGEVTSVDGDIAGGTTGHTTIGARKSGGTWGRFLNGSLDELLVTDVETSAEDIRETWRRLTIHQPAGVEMFVGLMPPGAPWYDNPSNIIGRRVKLAGQALGIAIAEVEKLGATFLPESSDLDRIARWETLDGLIPGQRDSLDVRRARVNAFEAREHGSSVPALQIAMAPVMAGTEPQILEFSNTFPNCFDHGLDTQRWLIGSAGWTALGTTGAQVNASTADDLRFGCHIRMTVPAVGGSPLPQATQTIQVKLATYWAALPLNTIVGLFLYNRINGRELWFGVKNVGGVRKLGYQFRYDSGLQPFVTLVTPSLDVAYWLRISPVIAGTGRLSWSTTGPTSGFSSTTFATFMDDVQWAGVGAMSTDVSLAANLQATFYDMYLHAPDGDRPFNWYAYRDPLIPGSPDMVGAAALASRIRPAWTFGGVCESLSVLCDDSRYGLCDHGPMGGI